MRRLYRLAPAFVIATVDKLARLAREGHAATLFGHVARRCERHGYVPYPGHDSTHDFTGCTLGENGRHQPKGELPAAAIRPATRLRPPDLIIQDELHLITGALGTTVGLFETAVETMCAWRAPDGRPARPLLVASSATVRNVADQVRSLYGRDVTIFPPQVLDASDAFFSRTVEVDDDHPGRLYVGLSTTGVRLTAAEIQTTQTVMAGAQLLFDRLGAAADPYMTLVGYFSATRELAGMARYVQDDIQTGLAKPGRDSRLPRRRGTAFGALNLGELTSRIASTDITATLDRMALTFDPGATPPPPRLPRPQPRRQARRWSGERPRRTPTTSSWPPPCSRWVWTSPASALCWSSASPRTPPSTFRPPPAWVGTRAVPASSSPWATGPGPETWPTTSSSATSTRPSTRASNH